MSSFDASAPSLSPAVIAEHLEGDRGQRRLLAEHLLEQVDRAVFHALRHHPGSLARKDDLVSELLLYLYRNDARVLRQWDPTRAGLKGYVSMVAGRFVRRKLATERDPAVLDEAEADPPYLPGIDPEAELVYRAALEQLSGYLHDHGSPKDLSRFRAMYVDGRAPSDVARGEGTSVEALHTWASRLKRRLQKALPQVVAFLKTQA
jgi:DNA-directed RNA polymerase specialized sigma24 family protein